MGTKNHPGAYDCYDKADSDEPMFVLLARDPEAPELVRQWARLRHARGADRLKTLEAYRCATAMDVWLRSKNKGKT